MAALLADTTQASQAEAEPPQALAGPAAAGQVPPPPAPESPAGANAESATGPVCGKCAAPMAPGQDWCLQCGAGAPGSVSSGGWGSLATILAVTAVLVLGAGAAAYAALSKKERKAPLVTTTVAQATVPPATVPTTTTPGIGGTPTASTPTTTAVPPIAKPPKIPIQAATPQPTSTGTNAGEEAANKESSAGGSKTTSSESETKTGGAGTEAKPEAILLDTDAASTYNPYSYPAAGFGDPSLTIDGDTSTGWSAQVIPASAPKLAEGVLVDLRTAQKVGSIELVTSTPGMTVQVYGANGHTVPSSITDPGWVGLSRSIVVKKHHLRIVLHDKSKKAFRFYTLWISRAGAASVGTAQAPGHVSVNELELFPPAS